MIPKNIAVFIVVLFGFLAVAPAYCQDEERDDNLMVFDGKVVSVDVDKWLVTVEGTDTIVFPISRDTKLQKDVFDIKLSDIKTGDYVNVGYYKDGSGSLKCVSLTVEYGKSYE